MSQLYTSLAACTLLLLCFISHGHGAAVMSIDLGSEWMKIGVVSPGVPMEIALNKESKRKTPTVIAFRDGARIFGEDAQTMGLRFPSNTFFYLFDLLGKTVDNPIVELYRKRFPYYEIVGDAERNTVVFKSEDNLYSVEELVAQLIQKAREFAEDSTNQQITECVLVVPGYFGQAERNALLDAANLANIKVLQLINDYSAVALNYGIFRRKEMNETAQYFVFYDMGAYKTSAAVVSYQLVKDKATRETNPVIQVLGVGYDRTLGGLEMQLRLRDYLATEFNNMKKTKTDVFTSPRALAKLFKEAGRVKNVLSANVNHFAQIEGLLDEQDFKFQVTREKFEELCKDLFERVAAPLQQALTTSGLALENVNQVILFGGGTRVPKVQEVLRNAINQDLGKNINMDEAAAMGAVYKAADLAMGFKVKKFVSKDAVIFPIQVTFEREGESGNVKLVRRSLFGPMNPYPQKKVITFNKHTDDFSFNVNYAELDHLRADELQRLGSFNLTKVSLSDVANIIQTNSGDAIESKGIKAHFTMDESGLFTCTGIELVVEKTVIETEDEGTLSKLGSTISKLFSSGKDAEEGENGQNTEEPSTTDDKAKTDAPETSTDKSTTDTKDKADESSKEPPVDETKSKETKSKESQDKDEAKSKEETKAKDKSEDVKVEEVKPKIVTVKEKIPNKVETLFAVRLDGEKLEAIRKKVDDLNALEKRIVRRETAMNALETFVIDSNQKLDEEEYASCATEEEIEAVRKACADVSEWMYEDGENAEAEVYEDKLKELEKLTNDIYARHWEHTERPDALNMLNQVLNGSSSFLLTAKNFTKEVDPEKDIFTAVEIASLEKIITTTQAWLVEELEAQNVLARNQPVRLTVKSISEKMASVDREVKYLVNKMKIWKPKIVEDSLKKLKDLNATKVERNETAEDGGDQIETPEVVDTETDGNADFKEASEDFENIIKATETNNENDEQHSEL
ncbi:hypoxia up-regulated protein 1 isoform X2 [Bradysia coprophila]|uniref:hypoxia up-regulated protein 1 isoform X1 n=1 Tax=Bradysia coprophila TaxID=38358 RepID=UPI00187DC589|nr:hypoxia up-regulated protein 1 isoform X1 [Bradysia coprophila]XP_037041019.1 hypoxia up-regulated protein 1 isoform X2 [Bradysia coprophila]